MTIPDDIEQALGKFGLQQFRPGQREVIESIVAGDDCMCVMPTGGGKSLCYQLPSIIRSGLTIVVSPLIALMKDQVDGLASRGISAALINSSLSAAEQSERLQAVASGHFQLVYVAPERLRNSRFLDAIRATPIQLLAVDEAHCISQWGHDFRPDYARIGKFRELLGGVQTVALTATATPRVREDIVKVLCLERPKQFMSGFARPNLHFGVVQAKGDREKSEELDAFLSKETGSGIIYCATRKRCEALVESIARDHKISVGAYHGGLLPDQRKVVQERFMRDELRIVAATNAFGMGIDKSDLRFVIHYNMPGSLEAYYQEAGRAGRDGEPSQCVMLYSFQDRHIQEFFIDNSYPERHLIQQVYEFLVAQEEDPIELTLEEIRDRLGVSGSPEAIGSCLQILARTRVLDRLEMGSGLAMIRIDSQLPSLVDLLPREAKVRRSVMRLLERAVGDRRGEDVYVHPRWLLQESGMQREALQRAIRELIKLDELDYVPPFRGRAVHFRKRGLAFNDLGIDFENLRKRKDAEVDRLNQVVGYAQSPLCRQTTILNYFGDSSAHNCDRCDRCNRVPGWPRFHAQQPTQPKPSQAEKGGKAGRATSATAEGQAFPGALEQIVDAIGRIHGRLGKNLISQYLCGSRNAKIQKLNLHRLSGFGLLQGARQADAVQLMDAFLAAGLLRQKEVNRNRPTVEVAPEWMDVQRRRSLLSMVQVPAKLQRQLRQLEASNPASPTQQEPGTSAQQSSGTTGTRVLQSIDGPHPANNGAGGIASPDGSPAHRTATAGSPGAGSSVSGSSVPAAERAPPAPATGASQANGEGKPDWQWTTALFVQKFGWEEVMCIRRMDDGQVSASLIDAIRAGGHVDRAWIKASDQQPLTSGQMRVVRELQRRVAAGV